MKPRIRDLLDRHGAVLLRGFPVAGIEGFERTVRNFSGSPLRYSERSSPRSAIKSEVYTSTDYPPDQEISPHNENYYRLNWPRMLFFYCIESPATYGATPLRTTAVRDAIHAYPGTGEPVWFNHTTFFHVSILPAEMRKGMLELFTEDELPSNTYYGDHGVIPDDVVDHLRECYRAASMRFDWVRDDVLIVDNMLVAYGREPFTGPRKIAVAMSELYPPAGG